MKLNLTSDKSLLIQGIIIVLMAFFWGVNIFYNWGYFDEYSGEKNFSYSLAYFLWCFTSYSIVSLVIFFIFSFVFRIKGAK